MLNVSHPRPALDILSSYLIAPPPLYTSLSCVVIREWRHDLGALEDVTGKKLGTILRMRSRQSMTMHVYIPHLVDFAP